MGDTKSKKSSTATSSSDAAKLKSMSNADLTTLKSTTSSASMKQSATNEISARKATSPTKGRTTAMYKKGGKIDKAEYNTYK